MLLSKADSLGNVFFLFVPLCVSISAHTAKRSVTGRSIISTQINSRCISKVCVLNICWKRIIYSSVLCILVAPCGAQVLTG